MEKGFALDREGEVAAQNGGEKFLRSLDRTFGPPVLLAFEGVHVHRHFRGGDDLGQEDELPSLQLGPIGQVEIFGQRVMLPTARLIDGAAAPDSRRAVEVEEAAGAVAGGVLDDEVPIEKNRLRLGQDRELPVEMAPAHLDHPDLVVAEKGNRSLQEIRRGDEVGIEYGDELSPRPLKAVLERPGFEAYPAAPAQIGDIESAEAIALHAGPGD